ncbi:sensor domain-containing protein [Mycolicibacterium porcinum]|uniref:sensor domain-containing protein n=1 Tax=Mycolicibacterium porcinum TaxID=39693 RepID=UPI001647EA33|nr:sensor domain-containing protein [Mycolicibacterium porcinum]
MTRTFSVVVCGLTLLATACTTDTSTSPSPNSTDVGLVAVSVDEVRNITGITDFHDIPELNVTTPAANPDTPEPCRAVFDPPTVFGSDWQRFRAVGYAADLDAPLLPIMADVRQAIAVYPDATTAQATFDRVAAAIPGCIKTGTGYYRRTAESPDPNTLLLNSDHADGAHSAYRLAGTALISVGVLGLPDSARVVLAILDGIEQAQHP